ncbi:MAG: leucine-rich repeat domain-containing protein [Simkaniaceae bacterium]|nr:leucine-rich repeat domain-containing protein [Simkaniaceae bacterium]
MSTINTFPLEVVCNILGPIYDPFADSKYALVCKDWNAACKEIDQVVFSQVCPSNPADPNNHAARKKFIGAAQFFRHCCRDFPQFPISVRGYYTMVALTDDKYNEETTRFLGCIDKGRVYKNGAIYLKEHTTEFFQELAQKNPEELSKFEFTRLSSHNFLCLPHLIEYFTRLETLNLSCNKIAFLPKELWNLTALKSLDLFSNNFSVIPSEIGKLTNLTFLSFSNQRGTLQSLPAEISCLTNLRSFGIAGNRFIEIPAAIKGLSSLETLFMRDNRTLKKIPLIGFDLQKLSLARIKGLKDLRIEKIATALLRLDKIDENRLLQMIDLIADHLQIRIDTSSDSLDIQAIIAHQEVFESALKFLAQCQNRAPIDEQLIGALKQYSTLTPEEKIKVHGFITEYDRERGVQVDGDDYGRFHLDNVEALEYAFRNLSTFV